MSVVGRVSRGENGKAAVSDPGYSGVGGGRDATSTRNCQGNGCCVFVAVGAGARHQGHANVYEPHTDSSSPPSRGFFFLMRLWAGHAADNGIIINIIRYCHTFGFGTIADVCAAAVVTAVSTNCHSNILPPSWIRWFHHYLYSKLVHWNRNFLYYTYLLGEEWRSRGWFVVYLLRVDNAFTGYWKISENVLKFRGVKLNMFISFSVCRIGVISDLYPTKIFFSTW